MTVAQTFARFALPALLLGGLATPQAALADFFPLSARSTFLRTANDEGALAPAIVELDGLGVSGGDTISLRVVGTYRYNSLFGASDAVLGVFSSSSILLGGEQAHRVPDAIQIDSIVFTVPTYFWNQSTEINEDFVLNGATKIHVMVPEGATHLFLGTHDSFYSDNVTGAGFGVEVAAVTRVPGPGPVALLGLAGILASRRRR